MFIASNRQIILDTETTGMNKVGVHYEGHRIIEIGAVEIVERRLTGERFHTYIKPNRAIDPEAYRIHGISDEQLLDKPIFAEVVDQFLAFIKGAELVIHNASFDIGFLDYELSLLGRADLKIEKHCKVIDSLQLARQRFPGKRNNLDALCERYQIDNSRRTLHGALLDAEILADVYLAMTGGQTSLTFSSEANVARQEHKYVQQQPTTATYSTLKVIEATDEEIAIHEARLDLVMQRGGKCIWRETADTITHLSPLSHGETV